MVRRRHLKRNFGLSIADFDRMLEKQGGVCAICGRKPPFGRIKNLAVDHDHKTGKIRGLLCNKCNSFLGYVRDDLSQAVRYVQGSGKQREAEGQN